MCGPTAGHPAGTSGLEELHQSQACPHSCLSTAVLDSPDFTDSFAIHTPWIETEFNHGITPDPVFDPNHAGTDRKVTVPLDSDGNRVMVGFPGNFAEVVYGQVASRGSRDGTGVALGYCTPVRLRLLPTSAVLNGTRRQKQGGGRGVGDPDFECLRSFPAITRP